MLLLALSCVAGRARAEAAAEPEASAAPSKPRTFRLGVGTGLTLGLSGVEETHSDLSTIGSGLYRWNVSVASSWQLARAWALGARGSWSSDAGARSTGSTDGVEVELTRSLWQLGAELRLEPRGQVGSYLSVGAGAAAARDSIGEQTATEWGPLLGAAAGYDWHISGPFALGLELRGGLAFFDADGAQIGSGPDRARFVYGTASWLGLNLIGTLGL